MLGFSTLNPFRKLWRDKLTEMGIQFYFFSATAEEDQVVWGSGEEEEEEEEEESSGKCGSSR